MPNFGPDWGSPDVSANTRGSAARVGMPLKPGALQDAIFNSAYFSSIATDEKGVIQIFNVGAERMLGYTADDVINRITPADISDPQEVIARAEALSAELGTPITPGFEALVFKASRGIEDIYELTYIRKDGSRFPAVVSVTALRDAQDAIIGYLLIGTDNTARKQASQYARSLLEASLDPLVTISAEGKITDVNEGSIQVTGVAREKLIGTDFSDYFTKPDKAREGYQQVFAKGFVTDYPLTIRHTDGRLTDVLYNASVYKDAGGNVLGVFAAARDVTDSKRVNREFTETKNLLDNILQSSIKYSIIGKDLDHRILSWNEGAQRNYGYSAEEIIGSNSDILHTPEDVGSGAVRKLLQAALDNGLAEGEFERLRKDGVRFPANVVVTRRTDVAGNPIGFLLMSSDISEKRQAEERFRSASQYSRSLIEASLDPLVTISAEGKITDVNEGSIQVTGVARERLIGTDFSDYFTEPDKAREGYQQVFAKGFVTDYPLTIRHTDGRLTDVLYNASVYKDASGNVLGVFAAARDVTARKLAEAALLKAGALQSAIFNSANFSSIATDAKGVIQIFNVGAERMLGYTAAEVMNKITPADISDPQEVIARAEALSVELGTPITPGFEALVFKASRGIEDIYELTYIRKDGSRFAAVVSVTALRDAQDAIIGYLLIGTDNTVRKQIEAARDSERDRFEQTLQEKNVELAHASRMKSEFLATMSHELRTPLNAIIGFSEALKDGMVGEMNGNQGEYVTDIFNSGQHLLSLINDILDLSKIEAGMMALELESVDLNNLLGNSLSIVRERAARQRIRLDLDIEDGLHSLQLDMRKTKQVIYNLLSNAVKFSAHGGRVVVRARRVPRTIVGDAGSAWPQHSFPLIDKGYQEFVELRVTDEGIGIPAASLSKLFQSFTQIDSSLARRFEGTGLGLAMVRQLVELHGGTVAVASGEGEGTCVVAWLPLVESQVPVSARQSSHAAAAPMERFAMIVEDDEKGADLIRLMLEAEGFTVLVANSAEAAMLVAYGESLSLITLSLDLPDMDGLQLLSNLRQSPALAKVPVLVIADGTQARAALAGGAAVLLQKPISRAQLKASLAMLGLHTPQEHSYSVLIVDDDPRALEVIASSLPSPAYSLLRALGGREAIDLARLHRPDLVLLDLMMPEVNGFDVIDALQVDGDTASIPILVVTAKQITVQDKQLLAKYPEKIIGIVEKAGFNRVGFIAEVRRALTRH